MALTLLQLVAQVQAELGLFPVTTVVASSSDTTVQQLAALVNRVGDELMVARDWHDLEEEWIISVSAPVITTGDITADSAVITNIPDTSGITAGTFTVNGTNVPQAARVASVDSATQVTMNELSAVTATGVTLTFSQDTYAMPTDFRHFVNRTAWDRSRRWELLGPISTQEEQWLRSGIMATGPRRRYRQVGRGANSFRIWPPPSASDTPSTLVFDYITSYWATDAGGNGKSSMSADDDTCVFPDDVIINGLKLKFFEVKGFDTSAFMAAYQRSRDTAMAQDGGARTLRMGRKRWPLLISGANVPDSGFGI